MDTLHFTGANLYSLNSKLNYPTVYLFNKQLQQLVLVHKYIPPPPKKQVWLYPIYRANSACTPPVISVSCVVHLHNLELIRLNSLAWLDLHSALANYLLFDLFFTNRPSWFMLHLNNRVITLSAVAWYVRMTAAHTCARMIRNTCTDVFSFSLQAIWPLYSQVLTSAHPHKYHTHSPSRTQWSKVKVNQIHSYYSLSVHIMVIHRPVCLHILRHATPFTLT